MRAKDKERVARYQRAYPLDKHTQLEILHELKRVRKEKKEIDDWIENQANINMNYRFNSPT